MPKPQKRKPSPHKVALDAFARVCGIASAPWADIAPAMAADLKAASYLRVRTVDGGRTAEYTIRTAIQDSGLIPIGGDIDGSHGPDVAALALQTLADGGQLTERAMARLNEREEG